MTVSKVADRSSRMRTDDLELAFAIRRVSVTESSAVSVDWPLLKPDCLAFNLLFYSGRTDHLICANFSLTLGVWSDAHEEHQITRG